MPRLLTPEPLPPATLESTYAFVATSAALAFKSNAAVIAF